MDMEDFNRNNESDNSEPKDDGMTADSGTGDEKETANSTYSGNEGSSGNDDNGSANSGNSESNANKYGKKTLEEKLTSGAESVKGAFTRFAEKVSSKAEDFEKNTQAKEKFGKFVTNLGNKVENAAKSVESKIIKNRDNADSGENTSEKDEVNANSEVFKNCEVNPDDIKENGNRDTRSSRSKDNNNVNSVNDGFICNDISSNNVGNTCSDGDTNTNTGKIANTGSDRNNDAGTDKNTNTNTGKIENTGSDKHSSNNRCESGNDGSASENSSGDNEIEHVEGHVVGTFEDKFSMFRQKVGDSVKKFVPEAKKGIKETASGLAPIIKEGAKEIVPTIKDTVRDVSPKVKKKVTEIGGRIKEKSKELAPEIKKKAADIGPELKKKASDLGPEIKKKASGIAPKVKAGAKKVADDISFGAFKVKHDAKKKVKNKLKEKVFGKKDENGENIRFKKTKRYSSNFLNHGKTVIDHRHMVLRHCIKAGIPLQGLTHDLSKFSPAEFKYGIKFFRGDMSPNEGEREAYGFSNAWMHHKGRNKHHFEYWLDYNIEANKMMPVKMPLNYVIEMFCDRVAAGKIYLKDKYTDDAPYKYFDERRSRRNIHPETSDFLEKLLKMLAAKGEDYTFTYIRWYLKHHRRRQFDY